MPKRPKRLIPDPDVATPHNEWYFTSWEMNFGNKFEDNTMTENRRGETELQEIIESNVEATNQTEAHTPDISNLVTDVGNIPDVRRPHPLKVLFFLKKHSLQSSETIREKYQKKFRT